MKQTKNYIDNDKFLAEIIEWRNKYFNELETTGEEIKITNSLAEKLMMICKRITFSPNFRNYTYREEMAEDALENSIRYFKSFNPEKSNNPFAYFSSVASMACIARINREKRQMVIKAKYIQGMALDEIPMANGDTTSGETNQMKDYLTSYYDFDVDGYEKSLQEKKEKSLLRKKERDAEKARELANGK